jgi:hypothetical protein
MADPRKNSFENNNLDLDIPRYFSDFPRIQVKNQQTRRDEDFHSLSRSERSELMEKLIDRVRDI